MNKINISKPKIDSKEIEVVKKILLSGNLTQGEYVEKFEHEFAKYIGTKYSVAVSNGTAALYLSLRAANVGEGDEVITTPFTFVATVNSIIYAGAKPVFVDIENNTFNIDPTRIEEKITKKTKAILPVHLYGLASNMNQIKKIAKKYKLLVIEDVCQSHGAAIENMMAGSFGDLGCFSFYPTKNMTTAEGGMVTTNNPDFTKRIKLLRNHGMSKRYNYNVIGFNFRMTDLQGGMGLIQLKKLKNLIGDRQKNALYYLKQLGQYVTCPFIPKNFVHSFNQYTIKIPNRDRVQKKLAANGIQSVVYYPKPIYDFEPYKKYIKSHEKFPACENVCREVLSIPIHPSLSKREISFISQTIKSIIK